MVDSGQLLAPGLDWPVEGFGERFGTPVFLVDEGDSLSHVLAVAGKNGDPSPFVRQLLGEIGAITRVFELPIAEDEIKVSAGEFLDRV